MNHFDTEIRRPQLTARGARQGINQEGAQRIHEVAQSNAPSKHDKEILGN